MPLILGTEASSTSANLSSFVSLATVTGTGSNFADFTSIPQIYTHLQIRFVVRDTGAFTTRGMFMEINGNPATTTSSQHYIKYDSASITSGATLNMTGRFDFSSLPAANALSNVFSSGVIDVLDYTNLNKFKTIKAIHGYDGNGFTGAVGESNMWSAQWSNTGTISSIRMYTNTAFAVGSSVALYGIK